MKNIKEIYEWSKITHENIQSFYEDCINKKNYTESLHRGCAMMAHLHFLSNHDFINIQNKFDDYKDYDSFMIALTKLKIFGINGIEEYAYQYANTYYNQFKKIK